MAAPGRGQQELPEVGPARAAATSRSPGDLAQAFNTGRCLAYHCGRWPGAALDMTIDGAPMGHGARRTGAGAAAVTISADRLPSGSTVEVVVGAVDHGGPDPSSAVGRTVPAASSGGGPVSTGVGVPSGPGFVRPQVRAGDGTVIGVGQATFLS